MHQIFVLFWLTLVTETGCQVHLGHLPYANLFQIEMLNSTLPTARPIFTTHGHGQNNTTSKLTTNYPHGSARLVCIIV